MEYSILFATSFTLPALSVGSVNAGTISESAKLK